MRLALRQGARENAVSGSLCRRCPQRLPDPEKGSRGAFLLPQFDFVFPIGFFVYLRK